MSAFEFILILVSVVAGFAVSEILSGWGRAIRQRAPIAEIAVHLIASFWLLLMIVRYVWVLWIFREIDWRFIDFVLAFAPILILALAAYVTNPARVEHFDPSTHYMSQARPACYLAALFLLVWNFGTLRSAEGAEGGADVGSVIATAIAMAFVGIAHVRKPVIHGIMFGVASTITIVISTMAVTSL